MHYVSVLQDQLQAMTRVAVTTLPSLVIGALVLAAAWILARFAANIVRQLSGRTRLRGDLRELMETLTKVAIWLVGFLLAATIVIPGFTFGGMVAGLGIGAVAIGFAFQDIFKNFLAGVLIMLREKMRIGDLIECEDIRGKVEHISLRETHVRQLSGELTVVPNSLLFEKPVQIVTDRPIRRDETMLAIDFDNDLDAARAAIAEAVAHIGGIDRKRGVEVFADRIDGATATVQLIVRWWSDARENDMVMVRGEVILAIAQALSECGVSLPVATTELITRDDRGVSEAAGRAAIRPQRQELSTAHR